MLFISRPYLVCGLALLCSVQPAWAQKSTVKKLIGLGLKALEVEVTGSTLQQENLLSVPSSATVFSGEEIRRMGINDLESLMNHVPGFQSFRTDDTGGSYTYSARGRRVDALNREVLVLVDGQRMTNAFTSSSSYLTPLVSMENVERVEFIRGPGSALYGSNAFLGVVNIVTAKNLNNAELALNSFEGARAHLNYSSAASNKQWKSSAFIKYYQERGEQYHDVYDTTRQRLADTRDPRSGYDLYFNAAYEGWNLNLSHTHRQDEQFYRLGKFSNEFNENIRDYSYFNLSYRWHWLQDIESVLNVGWRYSLVKSTMVLAPEGALAAVSYPASSEPLIGTAYFEEQEPVLTLHNTWTVSDGNIMQFGLEYRRPRILDVSVANNFDMLALNSGTFPVSYYSEAWPRTPLGQERSREVIGFYAQYQFSPLKDLTVTAGIRNDYYNDFGSSTNPRLALVYTPRPKTAFKLLYGEAFRAPSFNETDNINNPLLAGNPELRAEKSKTWEFVWVQEFERAYLAATYFDVRMLDSIGPSEQIGAPFRTFINGGEENSRGIELEAKIKLGSDWLLRGTLTHFHEIPLRSIREAETLASLTLNFNRDQWNWNLTAFRHGTRQFQYSSPTGLKVQDLAGVTVVNTKLAYQLDPDVILFAKVDNVLDKNYLTPAQEVDSPLGVPNRGRRFELGINWSY